MGTVEPLAQATMITLASTLEDEGARAVPMAGPVRDALASACPLVDSDDSWAVMAEDDDESEREAKVADTVVGAADAIGGVNPHRTECNDDMDIDTSPPAAAAAQRRSVVGASLNPVFARAITAAGSRHEEPVWASDMASPCAAATKQRDLPISADRRVGMAPAIPRTRSSTVTPHTAAPHPRAPVRRRKTVTVERVHIRLASGPHHTEVPAMPVPTERAVVGRLFFRLVWTDRGDLDVAQHPQAGDVRWIFHIPIL